MFTDFFIFIICKVKIIFFETVYQIIDYIYIHIHKELDYL